MRFGPVARGGLRWSDRREDFRTEVLGLVKAQMVKNTVIVPVGAKGGFFVKKPPQGGDRDAQLAEGIACYRIFINALLDITDNFVEGKLVHPALVVRHDADDPYLVVAADKGTATFSDIANADPGMSPMEIWCNEAQERYVIGLRSKDVDRFAAMCERERCPYTVIGTAVDEDRLVVHDRLLGNNTVDLPMSTLFGNPPMV